MFKRIPWNLRWPAHVKASEAHALTWIALGTNIGSPGQRRRALALAISQINNLPATQVIAVSSLFETPPWGYRDQPDFYNAVAAVKTSLRGRGLLRQLKLIERHLGRRQRHRWGPREIDLDILLQGHGKIDLPDLKIPHRHMHERAFVMQPLLELWPSYRRFG